MATKLATKTRTPHDYWAEAAQTESLCFLQLPHEPPHKCSVCAGFPYILTCPCRYLSAIFDEFLLYILAMKLATRNRIKEKEHGVAAPCSRKTRIRNPTGYLCLPLRYQFVFIISVRGEKVKAKNKKPPGVAAEGLLQEGIKMSCCLLWAVVGCAHLHIYNITD